MLGAMATPLPGWYSDGSGSTRWWDGQKWWDAQPSPGGSPTTAPAAPSRPVTSPPPPPGPVGQAPYGYPPVPPRPGPRYSGLAIGSFIFGLVSIFTFEIILPALGAIILGMGALILLPRGRGYNRWMAIVGLVLGAVYLLAGFALLVQGQGLLAMLAG